LGFFTEKLGVGTFILPGSSTYWFRVRCAYPSLDGI